MTHKSNFFLDDVYITVKKTVQKNQKLVHKIEGNVLAADTNSLVLKVWEQYGLRLKRKQPVSSILLPEISDILASFERVRKEIKADPSLLERSVLDDFKLDYERVGENPVVKAKVDKVKKVVGKVKNARNFESRSIH